MFARAHWRIATTVRRLTAFAALASFLTATTGVPLPHVLIPGQDHSTPFPCQGHRCGCATAAQCWQGCCCYSNREKVAWAAKHGVTPPDFVIAAAEQERPAAGCCSLNTASCCQQGTAASGPASSAGDAGSPHVTIEWFSAVQARKCQGQAELWLALGAAPLPPTPLTVTPDAPLCGAALFVGSLLSGVSAAPDSPPPRA